MGNRAERAKYAVDLVGIKSKTWIHQMLDSF
jgi:hypothetical protein